MRKRVRAARPPSTQQDNPWQKSAASAQPTDQTSQPPSKKIAPGLGFHFVLDDNVVHGMVTNCEYSFILTTTAKSLGLRSCPLPYKRPMTISTQFGLLYSTDFVNISFSIPSIGVKKAWWQIFLADGDLLGTPPPNSDVYISMSSLARFIPNSNEPDTTTPEKSKGRAEEVKGVSPVQDDILITTESLFADCEYESVILASNTCRKQSAQLPVPVQRDQHDNRQDRAEDDVWTALPVAEWSDSLDIRTELSDLASDICTKLRDELHSMGWQTLCHILPGHLKALVAKMVCDKPSQTTMTIMFSINMYHRYGSSFIVRCHVV